jgi:preprotein translocase subunit SecA
MIVCSPIFLFSRTGLAMLNIFRKVFGTRNERELKRIQPLVNRVNELEPLMKSLSDADLAAKTVAFKQRVANGESLDQLLPEAFATVREASRRVLGQRHFDVQLIGGTVLHEGKISEMKTGEGKTLTATLPLYLNALSGEGAHLVTANDYLARRDSEWMGQIYRFLGMNVGLIVHGLSDTERHAAYAADITYGQNNEFGFDYLRDNMKTELKRWVQRGYNYAIVDEVDSILIDEARTPLIISGPTNDSTELFSKINAAIVGLQKDSDYTLEEKSRSVALTEDGITKVEKRLRLDNLYDPANIDSLHAVEQSLKAHIIFKKDVDYVVKDNKVIIVDEHTGRMMPGRRYSDGLHAALEAKEHLPIEQEYQTVASITFQNYFRMYKKLGGMTGTADTEATEFRKIYNLDVSCVPTNQKMIRKDHEDVVFRTAREKFNHIADEIESAQKRGQPVLVGTVSVEKSELLAKLLTKRGVTHEILNAKNHAREADIIKNAGQKGVVTISTNMAGRGTDIVLGQGVKDLGGLLVIGSERHESRRIDNQLRGRSGRQGDPGESKFFLSLEDDLMRIFAADKLSAIMARLGMQEGEAIISPMVSRAIERAQKRVEEQNFSIRKHLLEYDDVMNQQRQVIYGARRGVLEGTAELDFLPTVVSRIAEGLIRANSPEETDTRQWAFDKIQAAIHTGFNTAIDLSSMSPSDSTVEDIVEASTKMIMEAYEAKGSGVGKENMKLVEHYIYLQVIDAMWRDHLAAMDVLKDSVSLRGYGQRDPLQEYKKEAFRLFSRLMQRIEEEATMALIRMPPPTFQKAPVVQSPREEDLSFRHPDAQSGIAAASAAEQPQAPEGNAGEEEIIRHRAGRREAPMAKPQETFVREAAKVGRNDPCPCGSGKKYKKCHGTLDASAEA